METKKLFIVGIGGRTGAMLAHELKDSCDIVGIGLDREIEMIRSGNFKLSRGGALPETLKARAFRSRDFSAAIKEKYPDFIWMATRNPVIETVKFYYRQLQGRESFPALILSQNGLSAIGDAAAALKEALGHDADRVRIIRVSLVNAIDAKIEERRSEQAAFAEVTTSQSRTLSIEYKIPIKLGFGALDGRSSDDLKEIFGASHVKFQEFRGNRVFEMENSKLFMNLIGMAAAVNGMTVSGGLRDKKMFAQESAALKEYIAAVKKSGGGFASNLAGYPISLLAWILMLPTPLLVPFRNVFERVVSKGRNRSKDLSEIDYYNGEAVKLGARFCVPTPVNEKIVALAKEINARHS